MAQVRIISPSLTADRQNELTLHPCCSYSYLASCFHLFDALVIVLSFVIDIASRGLTETIGSLVVVLRLWRLARISEEVVMGATERLELMEQQLTELEHENAALKRQLDIEEMD